MTTTPEIQQWNAKVVPRNTRRSLGSPERKPGSGKPFKRASQLYMQALDLKAKHANNLSLLQMLINALPEYKSRGHGRTPPRACQTNFNYRGGNYAGRYPVQGKSECARRVFQAMPAAQRAYIRSIEAEVAA
jgi:hypothetical protein